MKNINDIPWEAISKRLNGEADTQAERTLEGWLARSADNHRLFGELTALWNDVRSRASAVNPDREKLWEELRRRTIVRTRERQLRRSGLRWAASSFAAASVLFAAVWFFGIHPAQQPRQFVGQTFENISGKSRVVIPDGSQVWLHNDTYITCEGDFGLRTRDISLYGEACFDVEHDPARPFTVSVNGLKVTVHGTKFNIRPYAGGDKVMVGLLEGVVKLSAGKVTRTMSPGETALYDRTDGTISVEKGDVFFESLWTNDRLHIQGRSLGEICRYLERWYNTSITVDQAAANAYSYSFTITDEPLEEVLRIMNRINPISYRFVENRGVVISLVRENRPPDL